jgi:hypothetical protein
MFAKLAEHAVYNIPQSPPFRFSPLSLPPTIKTAKLLDHHHHNHSSVVVPKKKLLLRMSSPTPTKKKKLGR